MYDDAKLFTRYHFSCADIMDLFDLVGDTFWLPNEKAPCHQCSKYLRAVVHSVFQEGDWDRVGIKYNLANSYTNTLLFQISIQLQLRMGRIFDSNSNVLTFSSYSIGKFAAYKRISFEYFLSCLVPQNWSRAIFYFLT